MYIKLKNDIIDVTGVKAIKKERLMNLSAEYVYCIRIYYSNCQNNYDITYSAEKECDEEFEKLAQALSKRDEEPDIEILGSDMRY